MAKMRSETKIAALEVQVARLITGTSNPLPKSLFDHNFFYGRDITIRSLISNTCDILKANLKDIGWWDVDGEKLNDACIEECGSDKNVTVSIPLISYNHSYGNNPYKPINPIGIQRISTNVWINIILNQPIIPQLETIIEQLKSIHTATYEENPI